MSRQPIISHNAIVSIESVSKMPDARYKTGYRDYKVIHRIQQVVQPNIRFQINARFIARNDKAFVVHEIFGDAIVNYTAIKKELL